MGYKKNKGRRVNVYQRHNLSLKKVQTVGKWETYMLNMNQSHNISLERKNDKGDKKGRGVMWIKVPTFYTCYNLSPLSL